MLLTRAAQDNACKSEVCLLSWPLAWIDVKGCEASEKCGFVLFVDVPWAWRTANEMRVWGGRTAVARVGRNSNLNTTSNCRWPRMSNLSLLLLPRVMYPMDTAYLSRPPTLILDWCCYWHHQWRSPQQDENLESIMIEEPRTRNLV
jgi:hypothetical protein